jgi:hypothetical protein
MIMNKDKLRNLKHLRNQRVDLILNFGGIFEGLSNDLKIIIMK